MIVLLGMQCLLQEVIVVNMQYQLINMLLFIKSDIDNVMFAYGSYEISGNSDPACMLVSAFLPNVSYLFPPVRLQGKRLLI